MLAITLDMALQVILLDTRYHRDPFFSDGSILGETQWEWLQQELSGAGSEITIIASSIQATHISVGVDVCMSYERRLYFNLPRVQHVLHANRTKLPYRMSMCSQRVFLFLEFI
ncbi:uncharacterized protein A4U43_UnF4040 [Asparagus officinalis]|uniref:Uncharacterized protein n=1 Tax=Asparagus officinalis TaxID=4686 RepID=A0A1R3L6Y4_ASPOF|nr:uncharacterized protein A4U43_UnF4040 [Asparagus officinalis]